MSVETRLLSGLLLDFEEWVHPDVMELDPKQFESAGMGLVFGAIRELFDSGRHVDRASVVGLLESRGQSPTQALSEISAEVDTPAPAAMPHAAKLIRDGWLRRKLDVALVNARQDLQSNGASDVAQALQTSIDNLVFEGGAKAQALGPRLLLDAQRLRDREGVEIEMETGIPALDRVTYGLRRGWLWLIAARPARGKSTLGLQIALRVALKRKSVVVFSAEMDFDSLSYRALSHISGVDLESIIEGHVSELSMQNAEFRAELWEDKPLWVFDDCPTIEQVLTRCRLHRRAHGLDLVVVDYLQLLHPSSTRPSRQEQVAHISRGLKRVAKELDVTVIALSQLARKADDRANQRPTLADLKESGQQEQDADVVVFVWRDAERSDTNPKADIGELIVAKNRHGQTSVVPTYFNKPHQVFTTLEAHRAAERTGT